MQGPDKRAYRYFFVHVMKTAGGSFRQQILANFTPEEIYPHGQFEEKPLEAYIKIARLGELERSRRDAIRVFHGHFPYAVAEDLGTDLVTMTLLRDPIERILSYLRHALRVSYKDGRTPAEKVYEDAFKHPAFIRNHQAKVFAFQPSDRVNSFLQDLTIDAGRLEIAKENLAKVDLIGLTRRYPDFLRAVEADYGWEIAEVEDKHVSEDVEELDPSFVERVREDNAMDVAFYEYAEELWAARQAERSASELSGARTPTAPDRCGP